MNKIISVSRCLSSSEDSKIEYVGSVTRSFSDLKIFNPPDNKKLTELSVHKYILNRSAGVRQPLDKKQNVLLNSMSSTLDSRDWPLFNSILKLAQNGGSVENNIKAIKNILDSVQKNSNLKNFIDYFVRYIEIDDRNMRVLVGVLEDYFYNRNLFQSGNCVIN